MSSVPLLPVLIGVMALIALYFSGRAFRQFRQKRIIGGAFSVLSALFLALAATCVGLVGVGLQGFQRLTYERTAAKVQFTQTGDRAYTAALHYPDGSVGQYPIRGDEWQIDARMLTFKPLGYMLGFDAAYRLERLSGRYRNIDDERAAPRTVHALASDTPIDLWEFARRYHAWAPWVDAYYGNATYAPMADGAKFAVMVTQGGLKARALNDSAQKALGSWQ